MRSALQRLKVRGLNAQFRERFVHCVYHCKRSLMLAAQLKHAGQTVLECCRGDDNARPTDGARHRFPPCQCPDMVGRNGVSVTGEQSTIAAFGMVAVQYLPPSV